MRFGLVLVLGLALGCGGPPPIESRAGEIDLHQYPTGAHLGVLFVDPPTPFGLTDLDSALPKEGSEPIDESGGCALTVVVSCGNSCNIPSYRWRTGRHRRLAAPGPSALRPIAGGYDDSIVQEVLITGGQQTKARAVGAGVDPVRRGSYHKIALCAVEQGPQAGLHAGLEVSWQDSGAGDDVKIPLSVLPRTGPDQRDRLHPR